MTATDWGPTLHHRRELGSPAEAAPFRDSPAPTWIALVGLHDIAAVTALGEIFELHPLVIEDICNIQQRPKLEDLGHVLFLSMKLARFDEQHGRIEQDALSMVLGERYLLSFEEVDLELFESVDAALEQGGTRLRDSGPDYLLYRLMDMVVDQYIVTLEQIGDAVEAMEAPWSVAPRIDPRADPRPAARPDGDAALDRPCATSSAGCSATAKPHQQRTHSTSPI